MGLGHIFRYRSLLSIGFRPVQVVRQRRRKEQLQRQTTLSVQYKQQANPLLSVHIYTPPVISRNKNIQLTVFTGRNILMAKNQVQTLFYPFMSSKAQSSL